ncbi:MAG TPA: heavy metal translocating P-type ATPase metal-binding domain-containing protein [Opitutus sp.]|nr:heavy metal translocating P-type ATPase metal-binding domain-containing protein [Opitutus sp.]
MSAAATHPPTQNSEPGTRNRTGEARACRHCGSPLLDARMRESGFCCAGCAYVHRLVHEHGLAGYYNLKDDITAPADAAVFQPRDFTWLAEAQAAAEGSGRRPDGHSSPVAAGTTAATVPSLLLSIQGISCAGCVWLIERLFTQQPGARDIEVNAQLGQARLRWLPGEFSAAEFAKKLQAFGYLLGPAGETPPAAESRALLRRVGLCAAFALNVMLFTLPAYFGMERTFAYARLFGLLSLAFGTLSFLTGGAYFLNRAIRALREGALHIDLPIAIGIVGTYAGSLYGWLADQPHFVYFDFVATFIFLMLVGRWAQTAAVERNQRRLLAHQPAPARVRLADGSSVPPGQLRAGQSFLAVSGQTVPVESRLDSAAADFSLASINGESEPRTIGPGQRVPAGAINVSRASARLTALESWPDSLLAQLLRPAGRADPRHDFLEKIIRGYLLGILVAAAVSGLAWWFLSHDALHTWAVVTAVLVVSCPCAIGLAFPLADEMATVALRRRGVFVRDTSLWSKLHRVRQLVFDKTGTLTLETPALRNSADLAALDPAARAALLALVRENQHPVSESLLESLLSVAPPPPAPAASAPGQSNLMGYFAPAAPAGDIRETVGHGVELVSAGSTWSLGRPGWRTPPPDHCHTLYDNCPATADVDFGCDGKVVARFHFADTVRPDARHEIATLAARGYRSCILSGDRTEKVSSLARELGLAPADAIGGLTPQQKAAWLDAHDAGATLMLGDGANDSLAFDRALCRGTPVIHRGILESKSDFYYLGRGIGGLRALFDVNAFRRRTQGIVLVFSVAYNAAAVGLAAAGHMNPLVAAILMPANSLLTLALVTAGMRRAFAK